MGRFTWRGMWRDSLLRTHWRLTRMEWQSATILAHMRQCHLPDDPRGKVSLCYRGTNYDLRYELSNMRANTAAGFEDLVTDQHRRTFRATITRACRELRSSDQNRNRRNLFFFCLRKEHRTWGICHLSGSTARRSWANFKVRKCSQLQKSEFEPQKPQKVNEALMHCIVRIKTMRKKKVTTITVTSSGTKY